jgi:restriction system protein
MSFRSRWLCRRVRNKALFNYPKRITPKYAVKSYTFSYLLSRILQRNRARFTHQKRIRPNYTVKNQTSSSHSSVFWFWLVICIVLLLTKDLVIIAISLCILLWLWYQSIGTQRPVIYMLAQIDGMKGYEFEKCMKNIFEKLGYSVYQTPRSRNQGAYLILTSKNGLRIAVQTKRYLYNVSNKAVQEVIAAKTFHRCTSGIVVTSNYFTASAKELARAASIELIDRNELKKLINRINPQDLTNWYNQGLALSESNKYSEVIKAFEINPHNSKAWNDKGIALGNLNQPVPFSILQDTLDKLILSVP